MKLIIIHGAPAVGKYTVAKELEKETGYKLIHIHAIYDPLENVFGKERYEISLKILNRACSDIFAKAAQVGIKGLIFTYDLTSGNWQFARQLIKKLKKYKVKIYLVHLSCDEDELRKRVLRESRKRFKKTKTVKELDYLLTVKDYKETLPGWKTLKIDNTKISAKEVAKKIKKLLKVY